MAKNTDVEQANCDAAPRPNLRHLDIEVLRIVVRAFELISEPANNRSLEEIGAELGIEKDKTLRSIRKFEAEIQARIFDRGHGKGRPQIASDPDGRIAAKIEVARRIVELNDAIVGHPTNIINIGVGVSLAHNWLPDVLNAFLRKNSSDPSSFPNVNLVLDPPAMPDGRAQEERDLDIVITTEVKPGPAERAPKPESVELNSSTEVKTESTEVARETKRFQFPLFLIFHHEHPMAEAAIKSWADLPRDFTLAVVNENVVSFSSYGIPSMSTLNFPSHSIAAAITLARGADACLSTPLFLSEPQRDLSVAIKAPSAAKLIVKVERPVERQKYRQEADNALAKNLYQHIVDRLAELQSEYSETDFLTVSQLHRFDAFHVSRSHFSPKAGRLIEETYSQDPAWVHTELAIRFNARRRCVGRWHWNLRGQNIDFTIRGQETKSHNNRQLAFTAERMGDQIEQTAISFVYTEEQLSRGPIVGSLGGRDTRLHPERDSFTPCLCYIVLIPAGTRQSPPSAEDLNRFVRDSPLFVMPTEARKNSQLDRLNKRLWLPDPDSSVIDNRP